MLIRRRMLWVLVAQILLVLLMVDDFYLHKLDKLWRLIYPWGDPDRIVGVQYWLIPLVLGTGFLAVVSLVRSLSRTRQLQIRGRHRGGGRSRACVGVCVIRWEPLADLFGRYPFFVYPLGAWIRYPPCAHGSSLSGLRASRWLSHGSRWPRSRCATLMSASDWVPLRRASTLQG